MMDFAKLVVSGADARNFLQGQLTADMDHLDYLYEHEVNTGLAGLCNIKGRLEAVFWIKRVDDITFDLYLPKCISESIAALLKRYLFRSKATIVVSDADDFTAVVPQDLVIPWIVEATQGKYVPQMVSLDVLKGVHPRKGCYIGQEIVTRLRDLGKNKRRLSKLLLEGQGTASIGDNVYAHDEVVGEIVLVKNNEALAVLALAEMHQALKVSDSIKILKTWKNDDE